MRLRRKPWARPELAACPFFVDEPQTMAGSWQRFFASPAPLHLELGCGKGGFVAQLAPQNPQINFLAVDIKSEVLGLAKRKCEEAYAAAGIAPGNIALCSQDIERIFQILTPEDVVERIYINFCNPWPKPPQRKKRLTHRRQLLKYRAFLRDGGELHFKTDDAPLFEDTLCYLRESGFAVRFSTRDLHNSGYTESPRTEHEEMFSAQGIPICFLIAEKLPELPEGPATTI